MQLLPQQVLQLCDAQNRTLGQVVVERVEGGLILGTFTAGPDYAAVRPLFDEFAALVNDQILSLLDQAGAAIDALGLRLMAPGDGQGLVLYDVQIFGPGISCRSKELLESAAPASPGANPSLSETVRADEVHSP